MNMLEATHKWVGEFNAIPQAIIGKLMDEVSEITPPVIGDRIHVDGEGYGEVVGVADVNGGIYRIQLDETGDVAEVEDYRIDVQDYGYLPMWGTMWAFGDQLDNEWLNDNENLQAMAECGFRIYEQEDFEYVFGIDGAGYNFYEAHWVPLYKARGLQWHDEDAEDIT